MPKTFKLVRKKKKKNEKQKHMQTQFKNKHTFSKPDNQLNK